MGAQVCRPFRAGPTTIVVESSDPSIVARVDALFVGLPEAEPAVAERSGLRRHPFSDGIADIRIEPDGDGTFDFWLAEDRYLDGCPRWRIEDYLLTSIGTWALDTDEHRLHLH